MTARRVLPVVLAASLAAYLYWLSPALDPYAGGSDSSGYLWSARLFRHGAVSAPVPGPRAGFPLDAVGLSAVAPLGARVRPGTREIVPTYPSGLPLHLAVLGLVLQEETAIRALELMTIAAVLWLLYALAREAGVAPALAAAGCGVLASSPLFLFIAVQPMSDALATCWAEATILCAWRARRRAVYTGLAGAALGIALLVRPTNALLLAPVLAAIPFERRRWTAFAVGVLPAAAFVLAYQSAVYGRPFTSGYGDVSSAFLLSQVPRTLAHYARWLPATASWLVVFVPIGLVSWRGDLATWRTIAIAWIVALFGIYAAYPVTAETWWSLRFVLPAMPLLIVSSLAGLQAVARRGSLVIAAVAIVLLVRTPEFGTFRTVAPGERAYRDALQLMALDASFPQPVLMVQMSGAGNYYAPARPIVRYDELTPGAWAAMAAWQTRTHARLGAALFPFERDELLRDRAAMLPCAWMPRGQYQHITFWECAVP